MTKLTDKQKKFIDEYLVDLNATQAAIRAGYKEKAAYRTGAENLRKPQIQEEIQKRMEERQKRFEEETRNNFADIKLHLENITDRNISILAENHLNLINKMDVSATWMNRIMINEVKMNALTDQVARLQAKSS